MELDKVIISACAYHVTAYHVTAYHVIAYHVIGYPVDDYSLYYADIAMNTPVSLWTGAKTAS